jgi:integrase/recombinase XerC
VNKIWLKFKKTVILFHNYFTILAKIGSYKVFLRTDYQKRDGDYPIYVRVIIRKEKKDISLDLSCSKKDWNESAQLVKDNAKNSYQINTIIELTKKKASDIIFNYRKEDKILSMADFIAHFKDKTYNSESFYDFIENELEKTLKFQLAKGTVMGYGTQISKMKQFKPAINFGDINLEFIKAYKTYMIRLGNNKNTVNKTLSWFRAVLYKAKEAKKIDKNPFEDFTISKIVGNREFLSLDEVKTLEKLMNSNELTVNKKNVLRYFLFCCYTGLRYSDIKTLCHKHITDGNDKMIIIEMHKTGEYVRIPLIPKAENLYTPGLKEQKVFRVFTDQPTNRYLKSIMTAAKIYKRVSFHCARHTFATNALTLGIPIEVVSKILGHKDLNVTQIYAKVIDTKKIEEMKKFGNS